MLCEHETKNSFDTKVLIDFGVQRLSNEVSISVSLNTCVVEWGFFHVSILSWPSVTNCLEEQIWVCAKFSLHGVL